jgi:hypothetical protein
MRTANSLRIIGGVAVAALWVAAQTAVQAQPTIAYNFPVSPLLVGNQVGNFSLGTVFTVGTTPVSIDALGAFDNGADGIGGVGVNVAIYEITLSGTPVNDGTVVGTTLIGGTLETPSVLFSGTAQSLIPGTDTRVAGIAPVTLEGGTYMVVANNYGATASEDDYNPYYPPGSPSGANAASANPAFGVTFLAGGFHNTDSSLSWGSTLSLSGWTIDGDYGGSPSSPRYAAGNFEYDLVPEPSGFAIAGLGLLGLYIRRYAGLRRKMKLV